MFDFEELADEAGSGVSGCSTGDAAAGAAVSGVVAAGDLRLELAKMTKGALRKRAVQMGATEAELEKADDADDTKVAFIDVILGLDAKKEEALRAELAAMGKGALRKRAKAEGVPEEELEKADDADDTKSAFIDAIMAFKASMQVQDYAKTNADGVARPTTQEKTKLESEENARLDARETAKIEAEESARLAVVSKERAVEEEARLEADETARFEKETEEKRSLEAPRLKTREEASASRWEDVEEDSADEVVGVLSSIGRKFSMWTSVASIALSFTMSSDPTTAGRQIANMCRSQGGIYVKAAQTASSMPFAFPQEVLEEFQSLQDSADAQDWSDVEPRVEKHTPGGIDRVYEEFAHSAINAASIAQVHVARRRAGEQVAVKILRTDIQRTFASDISNYIALLDMYESATGIPVKWMMEWAMEELKKELDFRFEADLHEETERFINEHVELRGQIAVPELHTELCTKRLLVMEWIDGCKITNAAKHFPDWEKERDLPQLFEHVETLLAMQLFVAGKFHGDPHPGNIMVRRRNGSVPKGQTPFQVVVLDHGGYFQIDDETRKLYAELWSMMDTPKDEQQRLARRARVTEILTGWGVGHTSRFVLEQMFCGNFGTEDPTATLKENGEARRHRYNQMIQKRDDLGPPVFQDTSKMSPVLMKIFGVANFTSATWATLGGKKTGFRGWDFSKKRAEILVSWAKKSPGVRKAP